MSTDVSSVRVPAGLHRPVEIHECPVCKRLTAFDPCGWCAQATASKCVTDTVGKEEKVITQAMLDDEYAAAQTLSFPAKEVIPIAKAKKKSGKKKGAGSKMSPKTGKY